MESRQGSGRIVAAGALVFLAGILMARLLLAPGNLWFLFVLALPVLLLVLSLAFGFVRALLLVGLFATTVLVVRTILLLEGGGWPLLLLIPIVLLASVLAVRVVLVLWGPQSKGKKEPGTTTPEGSSREARGKS